MELIGVGRRVGVGRAIGVGVELEAGDLRRQRPFGRGAERGRRGDGGGVDGQAADHAELAVVGGLLGHLFSKGKMSLPHVRIVHQLLNRFPLLIPFVLNYPLDGATFIDRLVHAAT